MPWDVVEQCLSEPASRAIYEIAPETLIAESNHRIANNLAMIAGLCGTRAEEVARSGRSLSAEDAHVLLRQIAGRINTVARLHRLLARAVASAPPDVGSYLLDIALTVISSFSAPVQGPRLYADLRGCSLSPRQALSAGLIVGELVTNSVKYAHPAGVCGDIRLFCAQAADGRTRIEISDDGVGLPEGFDPETQGGLGLRLSYSLAAQIGAELAFEQSDLGLTARLIIPPAAANRVN